MEPVLDLPSRRLYTSQISYQDDESRKKIDGNALFAKTVLPHQLTGKPPLGSCSMKNMAISDSTVPVHIPDVGQSATKRCRA
jgi:hypothetical protein